VRLAPVCGAIWSESVAQSLIARDIAEWTTNVVHSLKEAAEERAGFVAASSISHWSSNRLNGAAIAPTDVDWWRGVDRGVFANPAFDARESSAARPSRLESLNQLLNVA